MTKKKILWLILGVDLVVMGVAVFFLRQGLQEEKEPENLATPSGLTPLSHPEPTPPAPPVPPPVPEKISPAKPLRNILFQYRDSRAKEVSLVGDFNDWSPESLSKEANHLWKLVRQLEPGEYTYKFIVDAKWLPDPNNPKRVPDGYGGESSLLVVKEK